ncbi:hypothetical protein [Oceaniferula spumae]
MKTYIIALTLVILPLFAQGDPKKDNMKWVTDPQRYETVTIKQIQSYCNEHRDEVAYWWDEYIKREKPIAPKGERKADPVAGMGQGAAELLRVHMTFFMNLRATQGWRVVGVTNGYIVFERVDTKR